MFVEIGEGVVSKTLLLVYTRPTAIDRTMDIYVDTARRLIYVGTYFGVCNVVEPSVVGGV